MSPLSTPSRRRATFHPLRVVDVERLTEAAAAIRAVSAGEPVPDAAPVPIPGAGRDSVITRPPGRSFRRAEASSSAGPPRSAWLSIPV